MSERGGIRHPFPDPPGRGEALEVAPGILWMRLPLPMALDHVNVYALADDDGWTIVDTGFDSRTGRALWQALLAGPLAERPVARVLVTHHHPDHVGLAGWFVARGAQLLMARTGWLMARMLTLDVQPAYTDAALAFYRLAGMEPERLAAREEERPFNFADCVAPLPPGFTRLVEGQALRLAGRDWTVRMGDGHAPEHVTLWSEGLVLGGDQLLPSISPNLGVYPNEPLADPVGDWLAACARLAPFAREDQLVLPGHKLPFTGLPLRMRQLAENHVSALDRLRAFLAEPRTGAECFRTIFKRDIGAAEYGLALAETLGHLNHLLLRGEARRREEEGVWRWQVG